MDLSVFDLKLIAMLVISIGSLLFGLLPAWLNFGGSSSSSWQPQGAILSAALCFGGGVLFATAVVDILPDVREGLPFWSEFVFCCGFFFIYFLDTVAQTVQSRRPPVGIVSEYYSTRRVRNYGAISEPTDDTGSISSRASSETPSTHIPMNMSPSCSNFSLLLAFSVHSLLEGLVIGLADQKSKVLLLLLAVSCHKLLVAFCLGAELASDGRPFHRVLPPLSVFVFGSAAGVGLGAVLQPQSLHLPLVATIIPILQGLSGGTLLYVVVSEILPREKNRLRLTHWGGLLQFAAMALGFGAMSTLSLIS